MRIAGSGIISASSSVVESWENTGGLESISQYLEFPITITQDHSIVSISHDPLIYYGGTPPYDADVNPAYDYVWETVARLQLGDYENPLDKLINEGNTVLIKPNWVDYGPAVYTRPEVVRPLIDMAIIAGATTIYIGDGGGNSAMGEAVMDNGNFTIMADELNSLYPGVHIEAINLNSLSYGWRWVYLNDDSSFAGSGYSHYDLAAGGETLYGHTYYSTPDNHSVNPGGDTLGWYAINDKILEADVIINVSKMKTHQIMMATMSIKNLVGCAIGSTYDEQMESCQPRIPHHKTDMEENYFNNDIFWRAILDMNKILLYTDENGVLQPTQQRMYLNVVDGIQAMEKSQHHEYGGGGIPYDRHVILAGIDPVAVDSVGCRIMGYDYSVIPSIDNADSDTVHPIGTNDPEKIVIIGDEIDSAINHVFEFNPSWAGDAEALAITDFNPPVINAISRDNYEISAEIIGGLAAYILYQAEGSEYIEEMTREGDIYSGTITSTTSEYQILAQDEYFNTVQSEPQTMEDTTNPTVTINQATAQADPTDVLPINFTVVFSEPVTGFESGDVTLSGTAGADTAVVTEVAPNDGTTYNVAVSGMTSSGTVVADIAAGVAQDGASNPNDASTSADNTVDYSLPNSAPTDIALDNNTIDENQPTGTLVGTFNTTDPDPGDIHTYSLVAGAGDDDNSSFAIFGDELQTAVVFNFESQDSYSIRVRTTDSGAGNLTYEEVFIIAVNDVPDPPVVSDIPNQTITAGGNFTTIRLDDYVADDDNADDEIDWSYSGNTDLTVNIDGNRIATITTPSTSWTGVETITFTATDPDSQSDNDAATFTVNAAGGGTPSGGGGGGMVGVLVFGYIIDSQGRINTEARAVSENAEAYLLLSAGTYCLLNGYPLSFITIMPLSGSEVPPPTPQYMEVITRYFNLGPDGSTFDPAIKLLFNYNPTMIPDGIDPLDMIIVRWNEQLGQWEPLETHIDPDKGIVWVEITDFSLYTVMVSTRPADISVEDLTITPGKINEGEVATVDALLVNSGDFAGTYEATLKIDGATKETKIVEVDKRDSVAISFTLEGLEVGTYQIVIGEAGGSLTVVEEIVEPTPAAFTVSSLVISPDEADIGDDVNVSVKVENTGESEGVYQVICRVDGVVVEDREITLGGGTGELAVFILTLEEAGIKTIEVNELSGSLVVKEEESMITAEVPTQELPEEPAQEAVEDSVSKGNWQLITGVIGGGVLLVAIVLFIIRRRFRSVK